MKFTHNWKYLEIEKWTYMILQIIEKDKLIIVKPQVFIKIFPEIVLIFLYR